MDSASIRNVRFPAGNDRVQELDEGFTTVPSLKCAKQSGGRYWIQSHAISSTRAARFRGRRDGPPQEFPWPHAQPKFGEQVQRPILA